MKKRKFFIMILFIFIFLFISNVEAEDFKLYSDEALLYNVNDNNILYEKNKDKKVSIASLTKMMTAIVSIEKIEDLNTKVSFKKSDYEKLMAMDAATSSLNKDGVYTFDDLLHGLLMESGADCANALARLTYKDEKTFVKMMNNKAKELGMKNTSFANPIGMDNPNNYSTMEDLSILFRYGLKNPIFKKTITTFTYTLSDGTKIGHTIKYYIKNTKLDVPYILGGKTGYENNAGYALATIAYKNGTLLMFITSNAKNYGEHLKDAKTVYDYYFSNYDYHTIIKKGDILTTLKGKYLSKDYIDIKAKEDIKYYLKNDYKKEDIKISYDGKDVVTYNDKYNSNLGYINISYMDKLVKREVVKLNEKIYPDMKIVIIASICYIIIITYTIIVVCKFRKNARFN